MPPRQEPLHITVHRADPAHKRVIADAVAEQHGSDQADKRITADAIAEQRTEPKQSCRPRSGQQPPRRGAGPPAAEAERTTGGQGRAGSELPRVEERAAKPAGGQPAAQSSKRRREQQPGSRSAVSSAASSVASGGAQRLQGSSSSDAAAAAAAAAQRELVRQTGREVKELCGEAERFIKVHCEFDAEGTPSLDGEVGSMMVTELHELQEQPEEALEDVLKLPAITYTDRLRSRIDHNLDLMGEMVEELEVRNELCTRPGCWHGRFDSDSESAEDNSLWARLGCAYNNPYYDSDGE